MASAQAPGVRVQVWVGMGAERGQPAAEEREWREMRKVHLGCGGPYSYRLPWRTAMWAGRKEFLRILFKSSCGTVGRRAPLTFCTVRRLSIPSTGWRERSISGREDAGSCDGAMEVA